MLRDQPFMRSDTFLGVCQALGDGFCVPSNLFRVAIAPVLVWHPLTTMALYLAAGLLVALLNWIIPVPAASRAVPSATVTEPEASEPIQSGEKHEEPLFAKAA